MIQISHELADELLQRQPLHVKQSLLAILFEMEIGIAKHPKWPEDIIHAAAVVAEEAGELIRASVNAVYEQGSRRAIVLEAVQTGAVIMRFLSHHPTENFPEQKFECVDNQH